MATKSKKPTALKKTGKAVTKTRPVKSLKAVKTVKTAKLAKPNKAAKASKLTKSAKAKTTKKNPAPRANKAPVSSKKKAKLAQQRPQANKKVIKKSIKTSQAQKKTSAKSTMNNKKAKPANLRTASKNNLKQTKAVKKTSKPAVASVRKAKPNVNASKMAFSKQANSKVSKQPASKPIKLAPQRQPSSKVKVAASSPVNAPVKTAMAKAVMPKSAGVKAMPVVASKAQPPKQPSLSAAQKSKEVKKKLQHNKAALFSADEIMPYQEVIDAEYMNKTQQEYFRNLLLQRKREFMEEMEKTVHHMQDEAANNFADPNDRATQEEEFGIVLRTRDRELKYIKNIEDALKSIDDGEYGYCEACGIEIGTRRLEARPTATLCIDCKTLDEIREKQMGS